jgi:hypothetical protein
VSSSRIARRAKVRGASAGRGVPSDRGRACGSFRLQKSTSGAWHRAPASEELAEAAESSLSSLQRRAKERSEAALGWQNPRSGGGPAFEGMAQAVSERALVEGRRFGPWRPSLLTKRRRKRSWRRVEVSASVRRDRERQRYVLPPRSRLTRPRRRGAVRGILRSKIPPGTHGARALVRRRRERGRTGRSWSPRRQARGHSSRPLGLWLHRTWRRRESVEATSRVERSSRCSCRECSCRSR